MKAKELRIGNWVHYETNTQVEAIGEQYVFLKNGHNPDYESFIPISLIDEWLLKFGFSEFTRLTTNNPEYGWSLSSFCLSIRDGKLFYDWLGGDIEVSYVHQLQNIYFAIIGEELEVK